jgi:hypothetical protein
MKQDRKPRQIKEARQGNNNQRKTKETYYMDGEEEIERTNGTGMAGLRKMQAIRGTGGVGSRQFRRCKESIRDGILIYNYLYGYSSSSL